MQILTKEIIKACSDGQDIAGVALVKTYSTQLTKKGDEFETGTLLAGDETAFKAWGNSVAFSELKNHDYTNVPAYISGKINDYMGNRCIIVNTIQAVEGYTIDQFLPIRYNMDAYWNTLVSTVKAKVSDYAYSLADRVLFSNKEVADAFKVQFAASSHHDNCKSGLLAHTLKVVSNTLYIIQSYPKLVKDAEGAPSQAKIDLLVLGALFHDIGKIREMNFGVYQRESTVTHRYLGIEYVTPYRDEIISHYSEEWYYDLISIFLQHHGEFGDPCRTVSALIINKADMLDAELTLLADSLDSPNESPSAGSTVKFDGAYLTIL